MKRLALLIVILFATCVVAMAQPRAIGGRLGWGIGPSYQHSLGEKNMLQVDLDLSGSFYAYGSWGISQLTATYNWIFPIDFWSGPGSWNWYAGVGGGLGYSWGWGWGYSWAGYGFAGVAGMVGLEYNFKFPLQLSLDFRPLIGPFFNKHGAGLYDYGFYRNAFALGVRYKF